MKQDLYNNEEVFVVPYQNTMNIENGFTSMPHKKAIWSEYDNLGRYISRSAVEGKKELQQLVPYIVIRSDKFRYFTYQVTSSKKHEYQNTMSIGISDHIKYEDGVREPLTKAAIRSLLENVDLEVLKPFKFKGYVREMNGNSNDHLGMVFLIDDIPENAIKMRASGFIGKWQSKKELIEHYGKLENWSKYIVDFMVDDNL